MLIFKHIFKKWNVDNFFDDFAVYMSVYLPSQKENNENYFPDISLRTECYFQNHLRTVSENWVW